MWLEFYLIIGVASPRERIEEEDQSSTQDQKPWTYKEKQVEKQKFSYHSVWAT